MKKTFTFLIYLGFLFFPLSAFGGGIVLNEENGVYKPDAPLNFSSHINYKDRKQGMVVSFETEAVDDNLLWIFPVPALPEDIKIGTSPGDVRFSGNDLFMEAGGKLEKADEAFKYSQIWPYFYKNLFDKPLEKVFLDPLPVEEVAEYVKIHKHLKEKGIEVYLTSAKEEKLQRLLREKEIEVGKEALTTIEDYMNEDTSFVVSFMEVPEKEEIEGEKEVLKSIKRGIMVEFPTEKIHYPLSAIQIYEKERIRVNLDVAGYVSPEFYSKIKEDASINYYLERRVSMKEEHEEFLGQPENIGNFTKVRINTTSKNLTEDLIILERTPLFVFVSHYFHKYSWLFSFLILAIFSFFVGVITVSIVSDKDRNKEGILKWGVIGLFNCLSIVGFIIRVSFEKMEKGKVQKPLAVLLFTLIFILFSHFIIGLFF